MSDATRDELHLGSDHHLSGNLLEKIAAAAQREHPGEPITIICCGRAKKPTTKKRMTPMQVLERFAVGDEVMRTSDYALNPERGQRGIIVALDAQRAKALVAWKVTPRLGSSNNRRRLRIGVASLTVTQRAAERK